MKLIALEAVYLFHILAITLEHMIERYVSHVGDFFGRGEHKCRMRVVHSIVRKLQA